MKTYEKQHTKFCPKCKKFGATVVVRYDTEYGMSDKLVFCPHCTPRPVDTRQDNQMSLL